MKIRVNYRRGLAMIGALLLLGAILIIGGTICYLLIQLCRRVLPPPPPPNGTTNQVASVDVPPEVIVLPNFTFTPIASIPSATAEKPLGNSLLEVERSTNLVDWSFLLRTNADHGFNMFVDDTNPPAPAAFYRMRIIIQ